MNRPQSTPGTAAATPCSVRYDVVPIPTDGVMYALNGAGEGAGQIVTPAGAMRAVWFRDGRVSELGTLGGSASCARGINDSGTIVGGSLTAGNETHHAFVYSAGAMHDLNSRIAASSGWELVQALAINNAGEIAAIAHKDGVDRIVILVPRAPRRVTRSRSRSRAMLPIDRHELDKGPFNAEVIRAIGAATAMGRRRRAAIDPPREMKATKRRLE